MHALAAQREARLLQVLRHLGRGKAPHQLLLLVAQALLFQAGVDARYTGPQWFLGDEGNETYPLNGYFTLGARVGVTFGPWEVSGVVTNLTNSTAAIFGTFNQDRQNGQLERFLTPQNAIGLRFIVRRSLGGGD